ncbi:hypothetical protein [Hymenobacter defluvii]|uniref:Uncharacterized protein n=1 Tax=Hymenobacter defluvii TaxID=2054411 RepID=A0ABS3TET1_9BACT|nr:hypothetical protein [Hymenobacter defluvii]MBO3272147.1 hypothetical protein [Hymenobacter defluvii]
MTLAATIKHNHHLWASIREHFFLLAEVEHLPVSSEERRQVKALHEAFRVLVHDGCEEGEALFERTMTLFPWLEQFRAQDRYDIVKLQEQAYLVTEAALEFCSDIVGVPAYAITSIKAKLEATRIGTFRTPYPFFCPERSRNTTHQQ